MSADLSIDHVRYHCDHVNTGVRELERVSLSYAITTAPIIVNRPFRQLYLHHGKPYFQRHRYSGQIFHKVSVEYQIFHGKSH